MGKLGRLECPICEKRLYLAAPRTTDPDRLSTVVRTHLRTHDLAEPECARLGTTIVADMDTVFVPAEREGTPDPGRWVAEPRAVR